MSWFNEILVVGVDPLMPGLYEWRIEGVGCYIGQYTRAKRPRSEYALNVERLLENRPYRKNNHDGFRAVHRELAKAKQEPKGRITLSLIENVVDKAERNKREQKLIAQRRREALEGGLPVLNATRLRSTSRPPVSSPLRRGSPE